MTPNSHTWQEIISQPQTWRATLDGFTDKRAALAEFLGETNPDHVLVTGCGSTHYLAQSAATTLTRRAGLPARALPASEIWLYHVQIPLEKTLLLAVSRSGTTTETLRAVERFRETSDGPVLAINCYPESTLARQADFVLAAPAAQEQSVAQTRSFTSMLLLTQSLTAALARDEEMLARLRRLPVAHHPLEFRHGPMSMVNEQTLVVGFLSDTGAAQETRVLEDMSRLGGRTLALVEDRAVFAGWQPDDLVELRSGLDEWERGPLYLPPIQQMAYHRAVAKGLNPDRPHNLTAVVEL